MTTESDFSSSEDCSSLASAPIAIPASPRARRKSQVHLGDWRSDRRRGPAQSSSLPALAPSSLPTPQAWYLSASTSSASSSSSSSANDFLEQRSRSNTCPPEYHDLSSGSAEFTLTSAGGASGATFTVTATAHKMAGGKSSPPLLVRLPVPLVDRFQITMDAPILPQSPVLRGAAHRRSSSESLRV